MTTIGHGSPARFTNRETEVLLLVASGRSAKEIAIELAIAPCTVERHIENVRLKTRTRNRAHMVAVVMQSGWFAGMPLRASVDSAEDNGSVDREIAALYAAPVLAPFG